MASAVISKSKSLISGLVSASSAVVEPAAKGLVSGNEQFVVKESGLLQKFIYSNLAEIPATLSKARAELAAATPAVNVGEMTVAQAGGVALTAFEIYGFFCIGEIIGRGGHLTGYAYE
ncbi:hypothetical protein CYMTET_54477 [Cymbomonas tetramitiformis]|uniref:Uncharacterized protein n=1 Tax=Cymbomonas tetramitiformis TaxID=36881 RepID=A0AAE0EPA9_9CHLO|nr:hypothetical protein CYMTET_54477 [Cymbomonas tetramitiformis]